MLQTFFLQHNKVGWIRREKSTFPMGSLGIPMKKTRDNSSFLIIEKLNVQFMSISSRVSKKLCLLTKFGDVCKYSTIAITIIQ